MKYRVTVDWSGYSRGVSTYEVEAKTPEEAKKYWFEGDRIAHAVTRDDTEKIVSSSDPELVQ